MHGSMSVKFPLYVNAEYRSRCGSTLASYYGSHGFSLTLQLVYPNIILGFLQPL